MQDRESDLPYYEFFWNDENIEHVAEHGVTLEEFEEVVCDPDRIGKSRSSGRPMAFGFTSTGKFIACVYEIVDELTVYPITAFEEED